VVNATASRRVAPSVSAPIQPFSKFTPKVQRVSGAYCTP
jgi:hypothetical protein